MPHKSIMNIYGCLTYKKVTLHPQEFHWADKQVVGLVMGRWLWGLNPEERNKWFQVVVDDLVAGGKIFGSDVVKTVPLSQWREALSESQRDATQGKYLVDCLSDVSAHNIKLHYFKAYGRAEAIRVLLAHSGVSYEDVYHGWGSEEFK